MEPVYLSIQQEATGKRMQRLIREKGYSVRDIQEAMGFESPQAIYKWLSGKCLPNLDNFLILSKILHTSIEDILVVDGDIAVFGNEVSKMRSVWNIQAWFLSVVPDMLQQFRDTRHGSLGTKWQRFIRCLIIKTDTDKFVRMPDAD